MTKQTIELPEHDCLYESTNEQGYIDLEPAYRKSTVLRLIEPHARRIAELEAQLEAIGAGGVTEGQRLIEADRQRSGEPVGGHDLNTSKGGRAYLAEFFAKRLRRHDFQRYIADTLAADFACVLSKWLRDSETVAPQPAEPTSTQERHARLRADPVRAAALDRAHERIAVELSSSAEPVNVSEARKYAKQELLSATDKAYGMITNSEAPQRFEGIFGRDAQQDDPTPEEEEAWQQMEKTND